MNTKRTHLICVIGEICGYFFPVNPVKNPLLQNEPNFATPKVFYGTAVSLIAAGDSTLLSFSFCLLPFTFYLLPFTFCLFSKRTQFPDSTNLQYTISNIQSKKRTQKTLDLADFKA